MVIGLLGYCTSYYVPKFEADSGYERFDLSAVFRYLNAFFDWLTLGVIASLRCLMVTRPNLADKVNTKALAGLAIITNWVVSGILVSPHVVQVRTRNCGHHSKL